MKHRPDRALFKRAEGFCKQMETAHPQLVKSNRAELKELALSPLLMSTHDYKEFGRIEDLSPPETEGLALLAQSPFTTFMFMAQFYIRGQHIHNAALGVFLDPDSGRISTVYPFLPSVADEALKGLDGDRAQIEEHVTNFERRMLCALTIFLKKAEEGGQYPVEVTPKRKHRVKKGQEWKSPPGPRIIYMDSLPIAGDVPQGGTHASPAGHLRRGHGRTLRHPRYKNHPLYMRENAMRIKPAWIGPTRTEYQGNIYTLRGQQHD